MRFFDPLPLPNVDAAALIEAFGIFRQPNPATLMVNYFGRFWDQPAQLGFYARNGDVPAWCFLRQGRDTLVLIDGCSTPEQARSVMSSYEVVVQSGFNNPDNQTFTSWSADILRLLEANSVFQGDNVTLVGWSAGGALAARIPTLRLALKSSDADIRVVSFGAPRLGDEALARLCSQRATLCRYMAFDDPIPHFPPRSGTFTWIPFAVGIRAAVRFANFCHHAGGLCIDAEGGLISRDTPTGGNITPGVALDAYWNSLQADSLSKHSYGNYGRLLALRASAPPRPNPSPSVRAEHRQDTVVAEVHAQERGTFSAVRELQQSQESQQVSIPRERLAQARRIGRVWYVVWNETAIMMTPTRRRAQGLARELNAFLRRMQSTAYVSPESLQQQIQKFLQLAADDQSDIRPTLSTEIPLP